MYLSAKLEAEIFRGGYPARILFVQVFTFSQVEATILIIIFFSFCGEREHGLRGHVVGYVRPCIDGTLLL